MGLYEKMLIEHDYIEVRETNVMPNNLHGLWLGDLILIKRNLSEVRKAEVLYEELAHHKLTYGNILDQSSFNNRKFENYARRYGYENALSLNKIIDAYKYGVSSLHEFAEYVQLSEEYVHTVLQHYKNKFGLSTCHNGYLIRFEPLQVFKYINKN
ncbi:ImmA/IrrE family metallo-endopeptidase [Staphylococcus carnosus]|uniref:ImmA/IrrE family metallo-endopeptidase n=1 Tax=Staphylococcus carnosus TaxID=1281 RepID=UPI0020A3AFBF|nr:ImmA/IrrE family metallo-endopeptidase [Staphylococcus carnosus]UTB81032.1 toxin [Staphylococcus carnosus]